MGAPARLMTALGGVSVGGWVGLLLESRGQELAALVVVVGSAMLAGGLAGARVSGFVLLEAVLLIGLAVQVPLLIYLWADAGPLMLLVIAALQLPVALVATLIARSRRSKADQTAYIA